MMPVASPSLRALLAGSVDYAGLFPPAGLPLGPALKNQATYVRGEDAWMLGRFVLPVAKLAEAGQLLAGEFADGLPLKVSALASKPDSAGEFLENLRASLIELASFQKTHAARAVIDQFEGALPFEPAPAPLLLRAAAESFETSLPKPVQVFWEIPFSDALPATFRIIAEHNSSVPPDALCRPFGVKLRTGGLMAAAFPTTEQLAGALVAARDAGVALKFTAGLHHPLRHYNESVQTRMHGFLNVFGAGVLAREHRLDAAEVEIILEDERPESFHFDPAGFAWRDRFVPTDAVPRHRLSITSFGSCSFDEPLADLRSLGLLK